MKTIQIQSSLIKTIGYAEKEKVLDVEFQNGRKYRIFCFPLNKLSKFVLAGSKGKFYHKEIKGKYPYLKIS